MWCPTLSRAFYTRTQERRNSRREAFHSFNLGSEKRCFALRRGSDEKRHSMTTQSDEPGRATTEHVPVVGQLRAAVSWKRQPRRTHGVSGCTRPCIVPLNPHPELGPPRTPRAGPGTCFVQTTPRQLWTVSLPASPVIPEAGRDVAGCLCVSFRGGMHSPGWGQLRLAT